MAHKLSGVHVPLGSESTSGGAGPGDVQAVLVGVLVPLSRPGWVEAGEHLLAGTALAVDEINADGGISGRPLELLVRDTAADPKRAAAAVDELAGVGVAAVAGEFHSVAARAAAGRADALGVPFLCSSAVLDELIEWPSRWVARLAPPQSRGWRIYADWLVRAGHVRIAIASQSSAYWAAGAKILRDQLAVGGASMEEIDAELDSPSMVCDRVAAAGATALLLLAGYPDPAVGIVRAVRRDPRLEHVRLGAPAGQPEFSEWAALLGPDGAGIPFLRYLPDQLEPLGQRVGSALRGRLDAPPSFVAFEGYDTITVLNQLLRSTTDREHLAESWAARRFVDRVIIAFMQLPGFCTSPLRLRSGCGSRSLNGAASNCTAIRYNVSRRRWRVVSSDTRSGSRVRP